MTTEDKVRAKVDEIFKNTSLEKVYSTDDGEVWIREICAKDHAERLLEIKHPKTGENIYTDEVKKHIK